MITELFICCFCEVNSNYSLPSSVFYGNYWVVLVFWALFFSSSTLLRWYFAAFSFPNRCFSLMVFPAFRLFGVCEFFICGLFRREKNKKRRCYLWHFSGHNENILKNNGKNPVVSIDFPLLSSLSSWVSITVRYAFVLSFQNFSLHLLETLQDYVLW